MRAPFSSVAYAVVLFFCHPCLVHCYQEGYYAEDGYQDDAIDADASGSACPSDRLLRSRDTCHIDGADIECIRLHCCDTHLHIAGRCIPKSVEPCSLGLCEQACEVRGERVWCGCHAGYRFHAEQYSRRTQPYCVDVDECASNNGGCEHRCVNDPGGFHCECQPPLALAADGRTCARLMPRPVRHQGNMARVWEPLPLIRASSRCYAPCDTVSWLSRKVKLLAAELHTTQTALKKIMENPMLKGDDGDRFAEGTFPYRVLDATAPLEGGFCRCERGPRGPPGAPGMEGPKGDAGARGPRGARGPKGSLDLVLLLLADIRHDIHNLEAKVYQEGEHPERFNLQKAWRRQRKQEKLDQENKSEQQLEAYTPPPIIIATQGPVEISPHGLNGEITHDPDSTTDWTLMKETERADLSVGLSDMDEKLLEFHLLANSTHPGDEEEDSDTDYDYSFY